MEKRPSGEAGGGRSLEKGGQQRLQAEDKSMAFTAARVSGACFRKSTAMEENLRSYAFRAGLIRELRSLY